LLLVHEKSLIATPQEIHKYLPIQLEAGQIWTTGTLQFAHDFFPKINFRYKSIYFIRDP
jgi:hypothetical protein